MSDSVDRDFNVDRPKSFRIRDQVFGIRTVRPEDYAASLRRAEELESSPGTTLDDMWGIRDERILLSLELADHDRWRELRARQTDGIELADLNAIMNWLTEVHTGRPTVQAEPSSPGPGSSEASSTAPSSSRVVRPAA